MKQTITTWVKTGQLSSFKTLNITSQKNAQACISNASDVRWRGQPLIKAHILLWSVLSTSLQELTFWNSRSWNYLQQLRITVCRTQNRRNQRGEGMFHLPGRKRKKRRHLSSKVWNLIKGWNAKLNLSRHQIARKAFSNSQVKWFFRLLNRPISQTTLIIATIRYNPTRSFKVASYQNRSIQVIWMLEMMTIHSLLRYKWIPYYWINRVHSTTLKNGAKSHL